MRKPRKIKPAVRLVAKPGRPHGGKHGAKGYNRKKAKGRFLQEEQELGQDQRSGEQLSAERLEN